MAIDDFSLRSPPCPTTPVSSTIDCALPAPSLPPTYPVTVTIQNFGTAPQANIPVDLHGRCRRADLGDLLVPMLAPGASAYLHLHGDGQPLPSAAPTRSRPTPSFPGDANPTNDGVTSPVRLPGHRVQLPLQRGLRWRPSAPGSPAEPSTPGPYGNPAKAVINSAASAPNCWVIGGLTGQYNNSEQSFLHRADLRLQRAEHPHHQLQHLVGKRVFL